MSRNMQFAMTLKFNGHDASEGLRRFRSSLTETFDAGRNKANQLTQKIRELNSALNGFSQVTKMAFGAGGFFSARSAINGVIDLERAMLNVQANLMSGAKSAEDLKQQMKAVRDTAREVSNMTIFSDSEMVTLTNQLLKSGVKQEFVVGNNGAALGAAALAQIGGITPEMAAGQLGALGNAFSFKTREEYMNLANHIVKADDASAMNSGAILYNMQQTSASAAQLKIDPKRMVSALAYLDALGNEAGTSMNRFLEGLAGTTKGKREALQASGLNFWQKNKDGTETLKDFGDVIETVRKKFQSMKSDKEKIQLGQKLFGEEGGRAAAFFSSKEQSFADFEKSVESSAGATDVLKVQMQGLGASIERLKNQVFSQFDTQFAPARNAMTAGVNALSKGVESGHLPEMLAAGLGVAVAGRLAWKKYKNRGSGAGGIEGIEAGMGNKVFVTNWPKGMLGPGEGLKQRRDQRGGGIDLPGGAAPSGGSKMNRFLSGLKGAAKFGGLFSVGMGIVEAGTTAMDSDLSADQKRQEYAKVAGGTTGSIAGAAIGGGIGALFGGFGAIPGAMIGGALGNAIGEEIAKWMSKPAAPIVIENKVILNDEQLSQSVNKVNSRGAARN
jgi:hypothetical protein